MDIGIEKVAAESAEGAVDTAVASIATKTMSGGAGTALIGWISSTEGIAIIGLTMTILGFIVNLIFKMRRDRREQELQSMKLQLMEHRHGELHIAEEREKNEQAAVTAASSAAAVETDPA